MAVILTVALSTFEVLVPSLTTKPIVRLDVVPFIVGSSDVLAYLTARSAFCHCCTVAVLSALPAQSVKTPFKLSFITIDPVRLFGFPEVIGVKDKVSEA